MNFSKYKTEINSNDINDFINRYLKEFNEEKIYIEILDKNDNTVFTNLNFNIPNKRDELNNIVLNERKYIIRNIDNKYYIFVTGLMNIDNYNFKLSYVRDISYIYQERKINTIFSLNLKQIFVLFSVLSCIL